MSGTKIVFDTNALIHFFKGDLALQNYVTSSLYVSIISVVEFLSFPRLSPQDRDLLFDFIQDAQVVDLKFTDNILIEKISQVRSKYKMKLPDAIIAAIALVENAKLLTNDRGFNQIDSLSIINF